MTEEQHSTLRYMRAMKKLRTQMEIAKQFHYKGMEHFLLSHGKWYEPEQWELGKYDRGVPKNCFANALMLCVTHGLGYVEGLAVCEGLVGLPIHHGWNVQADGKLIDSTWLNTGLCYFGVEFSKGRCDDAMWNGDSCVLDDYKRGHPLFRQRWRGEDYSKVWEPSEGMKEMKEMLRK